MLMYCKTLFSCMVSGLENSRVKFRIFITMEDNMLTVFDNSMYIIIELLDRIGVYSRVQQFYNLVMQTLWWLPIKILRHIHKKRFSVFLSRFLRICNQSVQKVPIREKNFFIKKFNMVIKKRRISRWFRIRWKSFEKMRPKKKYALFHFYSCSSNLFCL
jgi:hypothetical protein